MGYPCRSPCHTSTRVWLWLAEQIAVDARGSDGRWTVGSSLEPQRWSDYESWQRCSGGMRTR